MRYIWNICKILFPVAQQNGHFFAIYWTGLHLRKYNPGYASLKIPHSDYIPPFYKRCLDLLREFNNSTTNIMFGNLSCKVLYTFLINAHPHRPRIESVHPNIKFSNVWKSLQNKFMDPFSRDVTWRIIHEVIPVQKLLFKYKISKSPECSLCISPLESVDHLFVNCPMVKPMYELVFEWISAIVDTKITPSCDIILHHNLPSQFDKYEECLILLLLTECKYTIWYCRNAKKFDGRNVNSNYIIMFLVNRLRLRIRTDFQRLSFGDFFSYWSQSGIFCGVEINGDEKTLNMYIWCSFFCLSFLFQV